MTTRPASTFRPLRVSTLEAHLGYWLRFVSSHVSHRLRLKMEEHGVTVSEWVLLRELYRLGPVSASDLAHRLCLGKSAVSKLLDRLCVSTLVTREVTRGDRRQHTVALTALGRVMVPTLATIADENEAELFSSLSPPQREAIIEALKQVVRANRLKPPNPDW